MIKSQYEIYDNLPRLLKHYSLDVKMQYCVYNSLAAYEYLEIILVGSYSDMHFSTVVSYIPCFPCFPVLPQLSVNNGRKAGLNVV